MPIVLSLTFAHYNTRLGFDADLARFAIERVDRGLTTEDCSLTTGKKLSGPAACQSWVSGQEESLPSLENRHKQVDKRGIDKIDKMNIEDR